MSEWKVRRIKEIGNLRLGKMLTDKPKEGYILKPYLKSKNVGWLKLNLESVEEMYFSETELKDLRLKKNDLVISEGGEVGKTSIWNDDLVECYIQNSVHKFSADKNCNAKYYLYLFYEMGQSGYFKSIVNLVSIMHLTYEKLRRVCVPVPSLEEQSRIVSYLDSKTAAIDKQVSLLSEKRDAYLRLKKSIINRAVTKGLNSNVKMKASGVEWIGEMPGNWTRSRLKDCGFLYGGLTGKAGDDFRCDDESMTKPFIPFTNILNNDKLDVAQYKRVVMTDDEEQNQVKKDDLLFLMSSEDYESIAKSSVVVDEPGEVYLNSFCRGFRPTRRRVSTQFINYQLLATNYRDALRFEARGFTRINIKTDRINSMFVCLPEYDEQMAIVSYLDNQMSKIQKAVSNIDTQIEKYKLLKRALINEVVTGKRAV